MTRARLFIASLGVVLGACATDRAAVVTWEDVEPVTSGASGSASGSQPKIDVSSAATPGSAVTAAVHGDDGATADPGAQGSGASQPPPPASGAASSAGLELAPRGPVVLPGFGATVQDGGLFDAGALTLACVADPRALDQPRLAFERLAAEADQVSARLGEGRTVRVGRDPTRSRTDPPPRACRPLLDAPTPLRAPLMRERDEAGSWLVTAVRGPLLEEAARASARMVAAGLTPSAHLRAIIDDSGAIVALAIPVRAGGS